jgi:prepilin-type N-terminal cleavage/methylation domain-containing protein
MKIVREGRNEGFTVIEILIAVTLGALILASVYGAYNMVVKTTKNYSKSSDIYQTARVVLDTMAKEISGAYQPLFAGGEEVFLGVDEWYGGLENDSLSMITTTCLQGEEDEIGYDSFEISYYLGKGREDGLLYMKSAPYFNLEEPFEDGEAVVLAENVRSLDFKYLKDPEEREWVEQWGGDDTDSSEGESVALLPYAVRITISLGLEGEEAPTRFSTVAPLPMTPRPEAEEAEEDE